LNWKTLKECEELQIGLGLDLKGGMNVVLEVSVPDVVKNLAGESAKTPSSRKRTWMRRSWLRAKTWTSFMLS